MSMYKILLTGSNGLLGRHLKPSLLARGFQVIPTTRESMDVSDKEAVFSRVGEELPNMVVHAAAMCTPTALCDNDPSEAIATNVVGTCNVAMACAAIRCKLVYISTDYVYYDREGFTNSRPSPAAESSSPMSRGYNNYSRSKIAGDMVAQMVPNSMVLRCAFSPRPFKHDKAFNDVFKSYMYVDDAAKAVSSCIAYFADSSTSPSGKRANGSNPYNHVVNVGGPTSSIYDFAILSRNVEAVSKSTIGLDWMPWNTSMDLHALRSIQAMYPHD